MTLEPLISKAMQAKGYSRAEATAKAEKWLCGELGVTELRGLDFEQEWRAEAIIERSLLPPPKKHKRKIDVPKEAKQYFSLQPLGEKFWGDLKTIWGDAFFSLYFGEGTESNALLAPGQKPQHEWSKNDLILAG